MAVLVSGCRVGGSDARQEPTAPRPGPPPPRTPAATTLSKGDWYELVAGDTFHSLSKRSGIPLDQLLAGNRGLNIRDLHIGQKAWIPGADRTLIQRLVLSRPRPGDAIESDDALPGVAGDGYVLVPRSAWTKDPVGKNHNLMNGVTRITIHHTGEHEGLANLPELEVLRRIEKYHVRERKWCAIGYHFIVGKDGRIYEGRPVKYQGAHVLGENEHNIGISVSGDFMRHLPSPKQLSALAAFLKEGTAKYRVAKSKVFGHRDLNRSLCPGDALYGWLKKWKA